MQDKYKKIRQKRKVPVPIETLHKSSETFTSINSKKSKKVKDKRALIAARNITKKIQRSIWQNLKKAKTSLIN